MSDADLAEKFRDNAAISGFAARAEDAIAAAWALEEAHDVARLMETLA